MICFILSLILLGSVENYATMWWYKMTRKHDFNHITSTVHIACHEASNEIAYYSACNKIIVYKADPL